MSKDVTTKPVFLWCVPRSASTAFERAFIEHDDIKTMHEPFSQAYYFGPDKYSSRFEGEEVKSEQSYEKVAGRIIAANENRRVFVKDMAYHYDVPANETQLTQDACNTFLIRHPAAAINSLYKVWQDFTFEETGYEALHDLFFKLKERSGHTPLLMEAQDVCAAPEAYISHYCDHIGVGFDSSVLSWEAGKVDEIAAWDEFHKDVQKSTAIRPLPEPPALDTLPDYVRAMAEKAMPIYEDLCRYKIKLAA